MLLFQDSGCARPLRAAFTPLLQLALRSVLMPSLQSDGNKRSKYKCTAAEKIEAVQIVAMANGGQTWCAMVLG